MTLLLMNVTVIPFLLGAHVYDENDAEWNFGPEYTFHLNKTSWVFMDDIIVSERVTATIKCRSSVSQNVENVLFCDANIILSNLSTQQTYKHIRESEIDNRNISFDTQDLPNQLFVLGFNSHGVQNITVERGEPHIYNVVLDIVEQVSIGIDLNNAAGNSMRNYEDKTSGTHVNDSFTQTNMDTMRAYKCNTSSTITYTPSDFSDKNEEHSNHKNKTKFTFHLKLLPYTNSANNTLTIERMITACTYQPESIRFRNEEWGLYNMTQYYNVMKLSSTKFRTNTYLEGYVFKPKTDHTYYFLEDLQFKLHRMEPAQYELHLSEYNFEKPLTGTFN